MPPDSLGMAFFCRFLAKEAKSLAIGRRMSLECPRFIPFTHFSMSYVVASKVKELVNAEGLRCAGDFCDGLDETVAHKVKRACWRCKENGRGTVQKRDL